MGIFREDCLRARRSEFQAGKSQDLAIAKTTRMNIAIDGIPVATKITEVASKLRLGSSSIIDSFRILFRQFRARLYV